MFNSTYNLSYFVDALEIRTPSCWASNGREGEPIYHDHTCMQGRILFLAAWFLDLLIYGGFYRDIMCLIFGWSYGGSKTMVPLRHLSCNVHERAVLEALTLLNCVTVSRRIRGFYKDIRRFLLYSSGWLDSFPLWRGREGERDCRKFRSGSGRFMWFLLFSYRTLVLVLRPLCSLYISVSKVSYSKHLLGTELKYGLQQNSNESSLPIPRPVHTNDVEMESQTHETQSLYSMTHSHIDLQVSTSISHTCRAKKNKSLNSDLVITVRGCICMWPSIGCFKRESYKDECNMCPSENCQSEKCHSQKYHSEWRKDLT